MRYQENSGKHIPLAILLGGDKSFITIHLDHSRNRDGHKQLHNDLAAAYKDLCEKGLGHLIDINESVQNGIESVEKINLSKLQKRSAKVRQKKVKLNS